MRKSLAAGAIVALAASTTIHAAPDCAEIRRLAKEEASHRPLHKAGIGSPREDVRGYSLTYSMMGLSDRDAETLAKLPFDKAFAKSSAEDIGRVAEKACQLSAAQ
ncbi:hypothetical protein [Burkholderia vietnamiensis]|uniref:hypothetical protein n=1 Tax=Burkholderia vietnamiensis TaxID=60552 RepID=UPI001588AA19|nr:hypothetical protein [Burkholderia vietnamiensis]